RLVGLCFDRSLDLVIALVATLKAGGAYLPLDPEYPQARLRAMLSDAKPVVTLTTERNRTHVSGSVPVIAIDADREVDAAPSHNPRDGERVAGLRADHPAYVIYTSGSTGTPKGVVVTHGNVVRLFAATAEWFGFGATDVWTLFHSYAFDFSVW